MMFEGQKFKIYGLSPAMQMCIKNILHDLNTHSISDALDTVSDNPSFTQNEINLMIFEIGREFEKRRTC